MSTLPWHHPIVIQHSLRLFRSFSHWTGRSLLPDFPAAESLAQALFEAPFVLVSHGTQADPILNYGNRTALTLWELSWEKFTQTPSRLTAESIAQADRDRLLAQAQTQGFIENYQGIRISSTGRRFQICQTIIWDVLDEENQPCGQAASFSEWKFLDEQSEF